VLIFDLPALQRDFSGGRIERYLAGWARIMTEPIAPITLPPVIDIQVESSWLRHKLGQWLDQEFLPEAINAQIADRCAQIFVR
jgi:hypothetical protein